MEVPDKVTETEADMKDVSTPPHTRHKHTPVENLTRQELETKVKQLEAHNKQLQNLLAKSQGATDVRNKEGSNKKAKKVRPFDFTRHSKRHVLLKLAYLGWDYQGFAVQEDTQHTIEAQLFSALLKTRLIESRETSNYHRCGRTDKGVSAFDQVISITLRSKLRSGLGVVAPENTKMAPTEGDGSEINYVQLLNKVLPHEIRMLAWSPASLGYSARFDCSHRTYKYFFPRGNLNIEAMNEAAQYLVGYHDYRNFCKMDIGNGVVNFCRRILSVNISPVCCDVQRKENHSLGTETESQCKAQNEEKDMNKNMELGGECSDLTVCESRNMRQMPSNTFPEHNVRTDTTCGRKHGKDGYDMCVATIEGQAFLWHQVRAIMAVLLLVGEGKEEMQIVPQLLDVEKHPRKPQYCLASDVALNLYETTFEGVDWQWDNENLQCVIIQLQALWMQNTVRSTMIRRMLWDLESQYAKTNKIRTEVAPEGEVLSVEEDTVVATYPQEQNAGLTPGARTKVYRPLLSRPTCESLETRVEHYVKRQRLDPDILQKLSSSCNSSQNKPPGHSCSQASGQSTVSLPSSNMSSTSVEEEFNQQLFKRYRDNQKYLIPLTQYYHIIHSVKSAAAGVHKKSRNDYYLLSRYVYSHLLLKRGGVQAGDR
ncbi:tRNA pseudouridine(38/39) synthase-like isoform X2 [Homarus americanus]|uniref:tRNA pseudouridine(38/39) synthase-like isoform X2 n=1 Tax=Homarus americanus TaxID=6706 RepID=UPI001C491157|nr:tRNA pseudouridine(38/39) synthase-like isoform X2 [Homarus americanus]